MSMKWIGAPNHILQHVPSENPTQNPTTGPLADYVVLCHVGGTLVCRHDVLCRRHVADKSVLMSATWRHFMSARVSKRHDICRHVAVICRHFANINSILAIKLLFCELEHTSADTCVETTRHLPTCRRHVGDMSFQHG